MISRRNFLETSSGIFALPWLESFCGGFTLRASEKAPLASQRFVTLFFPNGVYPDAWKSTSTANGMLFEGSLAPLQPFASQATVIEGLNNPLGGHLGQTSGFLSGIDFAPDDRGMVRGGTSLDQMLAKRWGKETFIPALNLAIEPPSQGGFGDRPRSYGNSISWSSPTSKVEPQINPQQAFDQVFFGQTEAGRDAAGRRKRIVDAVWGEAKALQSRVSSSDQQKLAQYLDSIQDLEKKLEKTIHPDPDEKADLSSVLEERPHSSGIPGSYEEHLSLMMEIALLALQTNSTRVSTLVMGHSISRIIYNFVDNGISRNHHDYSHHRNDPAKITRYNQITHWLSGRAAYFLERMSGIEEGDGNLLDNSLVLFGSCMKDGNVHDSVNVPISLFGSAGGHLKTGRRIDCPEDSVLSQLHLSLLHLFGVEADDFNGVTNKTIPNFL